MIRHVDHDLRTPVSDGDKGVYAVRSRRRVDSSAQGP